jgi:hypothetical protein
MDASLVISLLMSAAACSTHPHGGTWPWDGLQQPVARLAPMVRMGSTRGLPGDARMRSRNVDNIEPVENQVACNPDPSNRDQGHRRVIPLGGCSPQKPFSLGFIAAADPRSCSPSCDSSLKLEWFDRAWGGRKSVVGGWQGSIHDDLRSFASVVRFSPAPVVMMIPRPTWGWGRGGFGSDHGGRGVGGRRGMTWY